MNYKKILLAFSLMSLSVFGLAQDQEGGSDFLDERVLINGLEESLQSILLENREVIEALASRQGGTDSENVFQELCAFIVDYGKTHEGGVPSIDQVNKHMNAYFERVGLGADHCYELCENYVSWTEWFSGGASFLWSWSGEPFLRYTAGQLQGFPEWFSRNTAHLNYGSQKTDQLLLLVALLSALTPYTYPLTLAIGLYYYDDLFPGEQQLIVDNKVNHTLLARMGYSGVLASVAAHWIRTWMYLVPRAGFANEGWTSMGARFWAGCAFPVGAAMGFVLDVAEDQKGQHEEDDTSMELYNQGNTQYYLTAEKASGDD